MKLDDKESEYILNNFYLFENHSRSHTQVWSKRQYAPMYIHNEELRRVKEQIVALYPEYTIVFDVIFESKGNFINWHTDHESLGPFLNEHPYQAICENHFLSIHFNLTTNGGALNTLEWPVLSLVNHYINIKTNIFSTYHKMYSFIIRPIAYFFAKQYTNEQNLGNTFNNVALHCITEGRSRISYVVRLIKTSAVQTSKQCILDASKRSNDCAVFKGFADQLSHNSVLPAAKLFITL